MNKRFLQFLGVLFIALVFLFRPCKAQDSTRFLTPASTPNKSRIIGVIVTDATLNVASLIGLNELWYKNYPKSSFHFFNDNREWLGMDKVGHAMTGYYLGYLGMKSFKWAGMNDKQSTWIGGSTGLLLLSTVEVLDGFSSQWGASTGDIAANIGGTALLIAQQLAWDEQRIVLKFSTHYSPFAQYRPELLGEKGYERIIKDYNGQTYWLSCNLKSFLSDQSKYPDWLNVALGYSANGMTGGGSNPLINSAGEPIPAFSRQRQFFLSPDIDLRKIPTKSRALKTILVAINFLKFPLPAVELRGGRGYWHWAYF